MNVIQPRMLSVFDFDGTLTRHDSFIPFLRFAFGNRAFSRRIVSMALPTLRCMGKQMTRDELKETGNAVNLLMTILICSHSILVTSG